MCKIIVVWLTILHSFFFFFFFFFCTVNWYFVLFTKEVDSWWTINIPGLIDGYVIGFLFKLGPSWTLVNGKLSFCVEMTRDVQKTGWNQLNWVQSFGLVSVWISWNWNISVLVSILDFFTLKPIEPTNI